MLGSVEQDLLRKLDGPESIGHAAIKLSVDEVGTAPEKDSHRSHHHKIVSKIPERKMVPASVPDRVKSQPQNASMTGHPPFPNTKENQRIVKKLISIIKKHVSETPPQKYPKEGPHCDEITHLIWPQIRISKHGESPVEKDADDKSRQVGQSVPTQSESPEMNQEGAQIMNVISHQHA